MKQIINLSSTALGKSGCILNLYRTVVAGYKEVAQSSRIVYGEAVHKYIDTMYKTNGDFLEARKRAVAEFNKPKIDDRKSMHMSDERHMLTTCLTLWTGWIADDSTFELLMIGDKPATEVTFSIPFYEDAIIQVNLCGTIDSIGKIKNGCYCIRDWKTTSAWDNVGYFKQYELSRQLRNYVLATRLMARIAPESTLGKLGATQLGCVIDAVFLKPDANGTLIKRSEVYMFKDSDLLEFEEGLKDTCSRLSAHIQLNHFPRQGIINGSCEGKWGKCSFWNVCKSDTSVAEVLLKRDFKQTTFNPLDYNAL